jgi:hypothetical protein
MSTCLITNRVPEDFTASAETFAAGPPGLGSSAATWPTAKEAFR